MCTKSASIRKYVAIPKQYEAVKWDGRKATAELIETWSYNTIKCEGERLTIMNMEGAMTAQVGDYIVRTNWGQFIPMTAKQFVDTYTEHREIN